MQAPAETRLYKGPNVSEQLFLLTLERRVKDDPILEVLVDLLECTEANLLRKDLVGPEKYGTEQWEKAAFAAFSPQVRDRPDLNR